MQIVGYRARDRTIGVAAAAGGVEAGEALPEARGAEAGGRPGRAAVAARGRTVAGTEGR